MASGRAAIVTITPQPIPGKWNDVQLQKVRWSGGSGSISPDDQETPERGHGSNIHDIIRLSETGQLTHEVPLAFTEQWYSIPAALRAAYLRATDEFVTDDTIAFVEAGNKIATITFGLFNGFKGLEGLPLFIQGAAEADNNSAAGRCAVIDSIAADGTEIVLDPMFMSVVDEAAGASITITAGIPIKNGSKSPGDLYRQYEVQSLGAVLAEVRSDAIAVDGPTSALNAPPGTFTPFVGLGSYADALNIWRPSDPTWVNNTPLELNTALVESVAADGSQIVVKDFALTTAAAGTEVAVKLGGAYAQFYDMNVGQFEFNYEGGGFIQTSTTYEVDGTLSETDRSRGAGDPLEVLSYGRGLALGRMVESACVNGVWFTGTTLKSLTVTVNPNLNFQNVLGKRGRSDPDSTHVSVSGALNFTHDRRYLAGLIQARHDETPVPILLIVKDMNGNRMVLILPKCLLGSGFLDASGDRCVWNPSFMAFYDSRIKATIAWSWVLTFDSL